MTTRPEVPQGKASLLFLLYPLKGPNQELSTLHLEVHIPLSGPSNMLLILKKYFCHSKSRDNEEIRQPGAEELCDTEKDELSPKSCATGKPSNSASQKSSTRAEQLPTNGSL